MRDFSAVTLTGGAFEGIMIHFQPIAAYNDNWRLYQNDFLAREHNTMLEVL
jgi:hypothetical protein